MPRSYPDWSNVRREVTYILREDLSELAARLGSINIFDRRGSTVLADSFEHGAAAWDLDYFIATGTAELSVASPQSGAFCVHVLTEASGSSGKYIARYLPKLTAGKIGVEAAFQPISNCYALEIGLVYYDGSEAQQFIARVNENDLTLEYMDENGEEATVAAIESVQFDPYPYFVLKLVADLSTGEYVRVILNADEHSLADTSGSVTVNATDPHLLIYLKVQQAEDTEAECYIDDVIVTQDEE